MTDFSPPAKEALDRIVTGLRTILSHNLVGIYLHGSLAMGCYNPRSSDIDFLAVVQEPLSVETKRDVIRFLLDDLADARIEMSIVLARHLLDLAYDTPCELHYSPDWCERYRQELADGTWRHWSDTPLTDDDLPAHVMMTVHRGQCLYGQPLPAVFPSAPRAHFVRSLLSDTDWGRERIGAIPVYMVLNLCRFYYYLREGAVASKAEGAAWAVQNLPAAYRSTVEKAWAQYRDSPSDGTLTAQEAAAFYEYMAPRIRALANVERGAGSVEHRGKWAEGKR